MPESLMVKLALHRRTVVAAAIFFVGEDTLFGRYWGAAADYHSLHFETCYHQGIEFCIERGLARFEPGTQGEHKVSRGFEPTLTWSAHYIADRAVSRGHRATTSRRRGRRSRPTRTRCRSTSPTAAAAAQDRWRENHHLAVAARCARVVSAARSRRWRSRRACWPPAVTCPRSA